MQRQRHFDQYLSGPPKQIRKKENMDTTRKQEAL